jgi:hypothetical protein
MREAASPAKIKRVLENMPQAGLVDLFTHFVRLCSRKKVFGNRPLWEIVRTLEAQMQGTYKPAPNQSPMPRARSGNGTVAATQAAKEIAKNVTPEDR